ncbi:MAG TPA: DUF5719 family protein [Streptosporangiaceae bacterium]|nr:DUF5719 family protein [Streptosporangiaceae bacterium]
MNRLQRGRLLFAVLVVLLLAGLYGLAGLRHPAHAVGAATVPPGRAAVTSAVQACAAPGSGGAISGSLAIAAMPGSATGGSATVTRLTPAGSAAAGPVLATASRPGLLQIVGVPTAPAVAKALQAAQPGSSPKVTTEAARGGVMVTATGAMAQGLAVEQTDAAGLVTAQCGHPGTSFWFLGPGQATAGNIDLYLMNTSSAPADAQLTLVTDITKGGPLLGNADSGISVAPHSMVVQSLTSLVQSSKVVALHVTTSVGQVVAAVRETSSNSDDGSWLPVSPAPASTLVIPGLPSEPGTPELYLAVPGSGTAQVKVTAVTSKGSYQPTGGTDIDLLGGTAAEIPLPSLAGVTGAVSISASSPVEAAMIVSGGAAGTQGALAAAAGPVQEQGVIADSPAGSAGSADLVLSAPAKAASVEITVGTASLPASGQAGTVVQVGAGSSVVVPIKAPAGHHSSALLVVVTPQADSGPVYAGWELESGGTLESILAVPSSPTWIPVPPVQSSIVAGSP